MRSTPRPSFKGNGDRNICKLFLNKIASDNITKMADWHVLCCLWRHIFLRHFFASRGFIANGCSIGSPGLALGASKISFPSSLQVGFSGCSSFEIPFGSNFSFFSCLASLCPANRSTGARVDNGLLKAAKFCSISWTLGPVSGPRHDLHGFDLVFTDDRLETRHAARNGADVDCNPQDRAIRGSQSRKCESATIR